MRWWFVPASEVPREPRSSSAGCTPVGRARPWVARGRPRGGLGRARRAVPPTRRRPAQASASAPGAGGDRGRGGQPHVRSCTRRRVCRAAAATRSHSARGPRTPRPEARQHVTGTAGPRSTSRTGRSRRVAVRARGEDRTLAVRAVPLARVSSCSTRRPSPGGCAGPVTGSRSDQGVRLRGLLPSRARRTARGQDGAEHPADEAHRSLRRRPGRGPAARRRNRTKRPNSTAVVALERATRRRPRHAAGCPTATAA
jgi:hypothetical protein